MEALGFVDWTPHLLDCDDEDGQILCSLGPDSFGVSVLQTASALLTRADRAWGRRHGAIVTPAPRYIPHAAVIGIAQLHHRPQTKPTETWEKSWTPR